MKTAVTIPKLSITTEEMRIKVLTQKVVSAYRALENIRSPSGVYMTTVYKVVRIRDTAIVDFNISLGFPHAISPIFKFPPLAPNTGLIALSRGGISGITNGIMVATQKNVNPSIVAILTSTGQEAQKGITVEKKPTTPRAAIRFPTTSDAKLLTTKALHEGYLETNHPKR